MVITNEGIEESIAKTFPELTGEEQRFVACKLRAEIPLHCLGDPWLLAKKIFFILRKFNQEEKTLLLTMLLTNGDSFDEDIIRYSLEYHRQVFPKEEQ